ncbi:RNAse III [Faunimonas pinastri]|uniref:Ribonuclease 3 n=1 Tax=Faunimonas pinastri TaxID=1855383 RepID=A0A1H9KU35_9HYPH|nr:ribonuclease III [Faunimonas pinastri]SER02721.1 RNAse III [Faunimonas pinastri]
MSLPATELESFEKKLGYSFETPALLVRALTHASAITNVGPDALNSYERLEFLGDRVLGLVIADMLSQHYPKAPEGELSRRLARLVSGQTCAKVAVEMEVGKHLRTGGSVQRNGVKATAGVLADACEAVIGAIYRDGGLEPARRVIEHFWRARLETMSGPLRDAKTELQEWAHRRGHETPLYVELQRSGPDHAPEFEIEVKGTGFEPGQGRGRSKREAEHEAAASVLRREGVWS